MKSHLQLYTLQSVKVAILWHIVPHTFSAEVFVASHSERTSQYTMPKSDFSNLPGERKCVRGSKNRGNIYPNIFAWGTNTVIASNYREIRNSTLRCICSTKKNKHELSMKESKFDHYLFNLKNILDLVTAFATFRKMLHSINKTQLC